MNFEKLLRQAQNGDKEAQEEIFRMYRPSDQKFHGHQYF